MAMTETLTPANAETHENTREPGHAHQTFLVGEKIYLRRIEKADAQLTVSWRETLFPLAPERTESWITDDSHKERRAHYAIVRKSDDRIVGSLVGERWGIVFHLRGYVDPLFGAQGLTWKAEAFRLVLPWMVDEQHRISLHVTVAGDEIPVIAALLEAGAREVARTPRLLMREGGERVDLVRFEYLNPQWIDRIGDPADIELQRAGTGEPRPVPVAVILDGELPRNAIAIGERVYLKPIDKEDAEELTRWSRRETETFYGHSRTINSTLNHIERRLTDDKNKWPENIGFAVRLRENDTFIGEVAVLGIDYVNRYAESASWIYHTGYRGAGFGSEAKHLLLEYAFGTLGLLAVESFVSDENVRSAAALRRQGYREVGQLHWTSSGDGGYRGDVVFHLTADEWHALPRGE